MSKVQESVFRPGEEEEIREIWKPIRNFPGYEVSDYGRIRSYWSHPKNGQQPGTLMNNPQRILNYRLKSNYRLVMLYKNKKGYEKLVHRLVLEEFIGPCPIGMQACHNNGNSLINSITNLRWDTPKNNQADRQKHGTDNSGERCAHAKITNTQVFEIKNLCRSGIAQLKVGKMFGLSQSSISCIVRGQTWKFLTAAGAVPIQEEK